MRLLRWSWGFIYFVAHIHGMQVESEEERNIICLPHVLLAVMETAGVAVGSIYEDTEYLNKMRPFHAKVIARGLDEKSVYTAFDSIFKNIKMVLPWNGMDILAKGLARRVMAGVPLAQAEQVARDIEQLVKQGLETDPSQIPLNSLIRQAHIDACRKAFPDRVYLLQARAAPRPHCIDGDDLFSSECVETVASSGPTIGQQAGLLFHGRKNTGSQAVHW